MGHGLQQRLLLLRAAGRLQLVHGGQVEEDALVQVERWVLLHQALQLAQGLLQAAQVQQAHGCVVVGLWTQERLEEEGGEIVSEWERKMLRGRLRCWCHELRFHERENSARKIPLNNAIITNC